MGIGKSPETPLYYLVPSQPDLARITTPLQQRVLTEVTRAFLRGEIGYRLSRELRLRYDNPLLTLSPGNSSIEVWGIDHPALQPKIEQSDIDEGR